MKTVSVLLLDSTAYAATVAVRAGISHRVHDRGGSGSRNSIAKNGVTFSRCGIGAKWGPAAEAMLDAIMDRGGKSGLRCARRCSKGERATACHPEIPIASRDLVWITQAPRGTIET